MAAADFMRTEYAPPRLLIGHSLGGAAVLAAALAIPEVSAVVTLGAPSDPYHVTGLFGEHLDAISRHGEVKVQLSGRVFTIQRQFIDDVSEQKLEEKIRAMRLPLLIMHAPGDQTVSITNAMQIYQAARHPKSFVSLDTADHLLTAREDAMYAAEVISAWSLRYIA